MSAAKAREYGWTSLSATRTVNNQGCRNYKLNYGALTTTFPCLQKKLDKTVLIHHIALQLAYLEDSGKWAAYGAAHGVDKAKEDLALDMLHCQIGAGTQRAYVKAELSDEAAQTGWAGVKAQLVRQFWSHVRSHKLDAFLQHCRQPQALPLVHPRDGG